MYNIKTLPPKQKGNIHKKLINILSSVGDYSLREKLLVTLLLLLSSAWSQQPYKQYHICFKPVK